ncbi:MAG: protein translocase subunit SecF [Caldilineaceae bacterium]
MNLMQKRGLWFLLSVIVMLPGVVYMLWAVFTGRPVLPLSIDYTGGTVWELRFQQDIVPADVRQVFVDAGDSDTIVYTVNNNQTAEVKLKTINNDQKQDLLSKLTAKFGKVEELSYRSVGPAIGGEVSRSAFIAVAVASLLILLYLAFAFRQVSHPFRYGICAVIALVHDVLVTISFVCIMHLVAGWEIDALFLTAILTVVGYSVSDTVVVFDRIRENLRRSRGESFTTISNRSIIETLARSIGTAVTTLLTLVAILLLGGSTLQQFVATLIVGVTSGVYSSIFNATALLVAWDEGSILDKSDNDNFTVANRPASA